MPEYSITITKTAQKQLDKLSDKVTLPLIAAIAALANDPRPQGCKKLKGREGYRIRHGDYRILYDIYDKVFIVDITAVGNRKGIYD